MQKAMASRIPRAFLTRYLWAIEIIDQIRQLQMGIALRKDGWDLSDESHDMEAMDPPF